jgi:uncharacterized protein (DUF433 family)
MEAFPGISMAPDIRFGKPCIAGRESLSPRFWARWRRGESVATVVDEDALTPAQIRTALSYVAHIAAHVPPAVRIAS